MSAPMKRIVLLVSIGAGLFFAIVLISQTLQLADFAARVHPTFGEGVFWGLVFLYALILVIPVVLFFRLPGALVPPPSESDPRFEEHLRELRGRLERNPRLRRAPIATRSEIEEALKVLDLEARAMIGSAGSRAFLVTAVSQNGALDALVMLGLQSRLVWDVAHVYAQRPSVRDMIHLYTNVFGTAFLAAELEEAELSEAVQPVMSSVLGSVTSAVPGLQVASTVFVNSVMSGTANAFLTLRVGIIAQQYSRALVRPERAALRRTAIVQAAGMLGSIATSGAKKVSSAVVRASGRSLTGAISGLGARMRAAGGGVRDRFWGEDEEGPVAPTEGGGVAE